DGGAGSWMVLGKVIRPGIDSVNVLARCANVEFLEGASLVIRDGGDVIIDGGQILGRDEGGSRFVAIADGRLAFGPLGPQEETGRIWHDTGSDWFAIESEGIIIIDSAAAT